MEETLGWDSSARAAGAGPRSSSGLLLFLQPADVLPMGHSEWLPDCSRSRPGAAGMRRSSGDPPLRYGTVQGTLSPAHGFVGHIQLVENIRVPKHPVCYSGLLLKDKLLKGREEKPYPVIYKKLNKARKCQECMWNNIPCGKA